MSWKEWVLFAISSAAFVMSLLTWLLKFIHDRKEIRIVPVSKFVGSKSLFLMVVIENRSRTPISITGISIVTEPATIPCSHVPQRYLTSTVRTGDHIEYQHHEMTLGLPVMLGDLGAVSGVLRFADHEPSAALSATVLTLRVSTTRGVSVETISLDIPRLEAGFQ